MIFVQQFIFIKTPKYDYMQVVCNFTILFKKSFLSTNLLKITQ